MSGIIGLRESRGSGVINGGQVSALGTTGSPQFTAVKTSEVKTSDIKSNTGVASFAIADASGDISFGIGNTDVKLKLPVASGIYKGASDTAVLTEASDVVTLNNVTMGSSVTGAGAWIKLSSPALSGATTFTIGSSSLITSTYKSYLIVGTDIHVSADTAIHARFTQEGSPITSSDYKQIEVRSTSVSTSLSITPALTGAAFLYAGGYDVGNEAYQSTNFQLYLPNPTSTANNKIFSWNAWNQDSSNNILGTFGTGTMETGADKAVDGVYLYTTTGGATMTGTVTLYGLQ